MGRLTRIENIVNSPLTEYSQIKIVPRGLPYFIDNLLRGAVRFGRRTGNSTAVINTDNTFRIAGQVDPGAPTINLQNATQWMQLNSIISVGNGRELRIVEDFDNTTLILDENLKFSYDENDFVLLHSSPIKMLMDAPAGSTQIQIMSRYPMGNGDVLVYQLSEGLLNSITEIKAPKVVFGGTSADPEFTQVYIMELEKPIQRDLKADDLVYIRAYPGYFSTTVRVPNPVNSSDQMGPFLLDNLSGRLVEGKNFKETLALKLIDRRGNYILGNDNEYDTIVKNYPVLRRPIKSHSFMFFEIAEGEVRFTPSRAVFSSSTPKFNIGQKLVPKLPANGLIYKFNTLATVNAEMRIFFHPYETPVLLQIKPEPQTHVVTLPIGDEDISMMEITILSESNDVLVEMADWTVDATVNEIEYSLVVEATGFAGWQSSGIVLKPYFLSTDLLQGKFDSGDSYDSGFLYF